MSKKDIFDVEELTQDKLELIAKIIKNDKKFANNEDLYDDFFNETYKRSFIIAKAVNSESTLTTYVRRIASTAILNVLKDAGRLRRTREGYIPTKEVSLESISEDNTDYSDVIIHYNTMPVDNNPEDNAIKSEILRQVVQTLGIINKEDPDKRYLHLFKLRYEDGRTQKEIAQEMNISQSEVSKRLFRLLEKIKQAFNENQDLT